MNEILILLFVLMIGSLLSLVFFCGLWWTIQKALSSNQPALWFVCSLLLRTVIVLVGFYLIGQDNWKRLVVCVFGFYMTRLILLHFIRVVEKSNTSVVTSSTEARHAP